MEAVGLVGQGYADTPYEEAATPYAELPYRPSAASADGEYFEPAVTFNANAASTSLDGESAL